MSPFITKRVPRRRFLRGAAVGVLGSAAALGIDRSTYAATARAAAGGKRRPAPSVAYWNGERFVPASQVAPTSLHAVRLTVEVPAGITSARALRRLSVDFPVRTASGQEDRVRFHAVSVPEYGGSHRSVFAAPVHPDHGLALVLEEPATQREAILPLVGSSAAASPDSARLRPGTYVVAIGRVDWAAFLLADDGCSARRVVSRRATVGGVPESARFPHLLITLEAVAAA